MNTLLLYYQRTNDIDDKMYWKQAAIGQMCFMRDVIGLTLLKVPVFAVSQHRSKSINLPIYGLVMRNGIKVIAEYDFHDWVVSIELPQSLPNNYLDKDLFRGGIDKKVQYYYGFKKEWEYDCYKPEDTFCTKFTVELESNYQMYMLMFLLNKAFPELSFTDNRTQEEIASSIREIYAANGVFELEFSTTESIMDGWSTMWNTYLEFSKALKIHEGKYSDHYILKNQNSMLNISVSIQK